MPDQPVTPFRPSYALCAPCARGDHKNCIPSFMLYDVWTWCDCKHDIPPIAAEADQEYRTRLQAEQVSWQFSDVLRPRKPQASVEDLPLFGGKRQEDLF